MKYQLKELSGKQAKEILAKVLRDLNGIDETEMTTFELGVIRVCATQKPSRHFGVENRITMWS